MRRRIDWLRFGLAQVVIIVVALGSYYLAPYGSKAAHSGHRAGHLTADGLHDGLARERPLVIEPLHDAPELVSDEQLEAVLSRITPKFGASIRPNLVEHAIRVWGVEAEFGDPDIMSGQEMLAYLVDHRQYAKARDSDAKPLLVRHSRGLSVLSGRGSGGSVHHDHWLACLSEAGISLSSPVTPPAATKPYAFGDVLRGALNDFRLDADETEWSALAFALWLPPSDTWITSGGRELSFDLVAKRLIRGLPRFGSCGGTHRVYSLVVLLRVDQQHSILSDETRDAVTEHLMHVRQLVSASQLPDGSWPSNWSVGADAVSHPIKEPFYKRVIATGHHLEWLAIAPNRFHPSDESIQRAADWCVRATVERPDDEIYQNYTYYSHIGNALAMWRRVRPADFWRRTSQETPFPTTASDVP